MNKIIIGQECVCPDGLGRVIKVIEDVCTRKIKVDTYVDNRSCEWDEHNVKLIPVLNLPKEKTKTELLKENFNKIPRAYITNSSSDGFMFRKGWDSLGNYLVDNGLIEKEDLPK